jgi:hypothetical protein
MSESLYIHGLIYCRHEPADLNERLSVSQEGFWSTWTSLLSWGSFNCKQVLIRNVSSDM